MFQNMGTRAEKEYGNNSRKKCFRKMGTGAEKKKTKR
jgi:hypothetical protein